ncbi:MAG: acyltransferase [Treponema sp.]|jgi:surface polysaccharide O-acyltransferase-like enzyme|nr:acyltransferase [Treponema sp.]
MYNNKDSRQQTADSRQQTADSRQQTADSRQQTADSRQQTILDPLLSKRIHSLRFLLIVFVVFIHNTVINAGVNFSDGSQTFEAPLYVEKVKELAGTFTGIAVPLFFLISGFLLYIKEQKFLGNLKKKCRTILLPYILWAILVILFLFVAQSFSFTKPYFATRIVREFSPLDWIGVFAGHFGKFAVPYGHPLVYQFWFLRDLFVLNLLFVIIKKIVDRCPGGTLVLFFILWIGDIDIYIVSTAALFFFTLGYYIVKYNISYKHLDNIKTFDMIIMYMTTIIIKLFFREHIAIISAINIMVGIMFFIKLSYSFINKTKVYKILAWLEQYAFWVYATHGIAIAIIIKLSVKIMPMNGGWLLVHYFIVTLLCIFILLGIGILFKKIFPKVFSILTGGR